MSLAAGRLRHKVDIQAFTGASDGAGGTVKTWSTVAKRVAAEVIPINGGEAFNRGIAAATQFYRVTIRYRAGITPAHRLIWKGIALNIRTCADPDGTWEALLMTVESGAGEPA
jgi:SPP1 family predicted phage head-tail adaptor